MQLANMIMRIAIVCMIATHLQTYGSRHLPDNYQSIYVTVFAKTYHLHTRNT